MFTKFVKKRDNMNIIIELKNYTIFNLINLGIKIHVSYNFFSYKKLKISKIVNFL